MAGSRIAQAVSFLSLASAALAAPLTSLNEANVLAREASSVADICSTSSSCIPFTVEVTWGSSNPIGAGARGSILVNGTTPGPALRMKVGECVDFTVINSLAVDTSVHFHGISQMGTPWADGTPGLAQAAIKPGKTWMYQWTADEQGAYFYHSHYKGQLMDGLYGAIFISPSDGEVGPWSMIDSSAVDELAAADEKSEPMFIADWTQYTFDELFAIEQNGNIDIACADAIIINGLGNQYCLDRADITAQSAPQIANLTGGTGYTNKACLPANVSTQGAWAHNLAAIPDDVFDVCSTSSNQNYTLTVDAADGYAAMTFCNTGGFTLMKVTIDNHKLIAYEYNGRWMTPQTVDQIFVGNGERVKVMIKLDQAVGNYQIRVSNNGLNQLISGFGVLSYKGASAGLSAASVPLMTYGGVNLTAITQFAAPMAAPYPAIVPSQTVDKTWFFNVQREPNVSLSWEWSLQGDASYSMANDDDTPLLYKDPSTVPETDLIFKSNYGQWVDIIMQSTGPIAQPHPMHKHGNKFFAIGQGVGSFNWSTVAEAQAVIPEAFNLVNPPYVDGYVTLPGEGTNTWTVLRYQVEDVGVWYLHCHMQTHLSGGMAIVMMDGVDKFPTIPSDVGTFCPGSGKSNSTWEPSCYCPSSCAANPSTNSSSSSGVSSGSDADTSITSSGSNSGSWVNGVWTGSNNPTTSNETGYEPSSNTGSYSGDGLKSSTISNSTNGTSSSSPATYAGNSASASQVSLLTVLALAIAALVL